MKKIFTIILGLLVLAPGLAFAVPSNGQGTSSENNDSSLTNPNVQTTTGNTDSANSSQKPIDQQITTGTQSQIETQTQTNNPGTGIMTQTQTRTEAQIQQDISQAGFKYMPKSSKGLEQGSVVANAAQELTRVAAQIMNKGIGDQVRTIAQTQINNQDKIGQSIDKTEARTGFAKFFIGANYKELKLVKNTLTENQTQIKELQQIMIQLTSDTDKIAIANQVIVLQQTQLQLKDQLSDLSKGFSLFGWISRWKNNF